MEKSGKICLAALVKSSEEMEQNNKNFRTQSDKQNRRQPGQDGNREEKPTKNEESMKTPGGNKPQQTTPIKVLAENLQNKEESVRITRGVLEDISKIKKMTPTYIVIKNSGIPIVISDTNLQIAQTASCAGNGVNNETLGTPVQINKLSKGSLMHKLLAHMDQVTVL